MAPDWCNGKAFALLLWGNWMGGMAYSLYPINHRDTSQSWVSVSTCVWKTADSTFLWVCYSVLWHSMSSSSKGCDWLASCFLAETCTSFHPHCSMCGVRKWRTCCRRVWHCSLVLSTCEENVWSPGCCPSFSPNMFRVLNCSSSVDFRLNFSSSSCKQMIKFLYGSA